MRHTSWWTGLAIAFWAGSAILLLGGRAAAQQRAVGDFDHPPAKRPPHDDLGGTVTPPPQPYGGQLFCPVTGVKLGLNQPPVPVQTAIGEQKPSWVARMFGAKPVAGAVIYVCCPQCVDKVRSNPEFYLTEVIADRACFTFTYATAPAQRPPRTRQSHDE